MARNTLATAAVVGEEEAGRLATTGGTTEVGEEGAAGRGGQSEADHHHLSGSAAEGGMWLELEPGADGALAFIMQGLGVSSSAFNK